MLGRLCEVCSQSFVVFHDLIFEKKPSMSGLWLTFAFQMRFAMKVGATFLRMQAFRKAVENLKVRIRPLAFTTLFRTAICCLLYLCRR